MLVLSRRKNEGVSLPSVGVNFEILRIAGNSVRIGVKAPRNMPILRSELESHGKNNASTEPPDANARPDTPAEKSRPPCGEEDARDVGKTFTCMQFALQLAQAHLEQGQIDEAQRVLRQAAERLDRARSLLAKPAAAKADRGLTALVVEKDQRQCRQIADVLREGGYHVEVVDDADQALDFLAIRPKPNLVIFDTRRSRQRTSRAVQKIRRNPQWDGIKIFALGEPAAELQVRLEPSGVDRWVQRPVADETLLDEIADEMVGHDSA